MNAFEKNNAYDGTATAYDYSEERASENVFDSRDGFAGRFYKTEREASAPARTFTIEREQPAERRVAENSDIEPTSTTMQFLGRKNVLEDYREEPAVYSEKKFKINAKAKVFIAVYALVIATIFALIILNTTLLKSVDKTVVAKNAEIEALEAQNAELKNTLEYVSDDAVIELKAAERGMIKK